MLAVGRREDRLAELERRASAVTAAVATSAIDLREPSAARIIIDAARDRFGTVNVLVNNAGGVAVGRVTAQTDEQLREQFETHVHVPLALVREALPLLRASRGHVFFVGSGVARVPVAGLGALPEREGGGALGRAHRPQRVARGRHQRDLRRSRAPSTRSS